VTSDLELAKACCRGDEDAWREFRERYFSYIRDFAKRFVHERAAADVADQVIADLWQRSRLAQYDGRSTLKTWLGAVVAHAAINAGKVERRTTTLTPRMWERASMTTGAAADAESGRAFTLLVERAIEELTPDSKLLLLLYYEQGLTLDEMANVVGGSKATLSRRLSGVRSALRDAIDANARRELRVDADALRERLDFARLEFDLAAALGGSRMEGKGDGVV
jgi:RNA polymerase sigma factor (sigma-70 family)